MAEIRVNSTGGVKLFDADDSHYAQIKAGTISSNTDVLELGSSAVVAGTKVDLNGQELILDADADTSITADTDDQIDIRVAGTDQLTIKDGALSPVTDNDVDIGTSSLEFKDGYFDGTLHCDVLDLAGTEYTSIPSLAGIDDQTSSNDDQITIADGEVCINEDSDDLDFRVEGNSNTHQLFVDGGNALVMIEQHGAPGTRILPGDDSSGLQVKGNSNSSSRILASRHSADANGPALTLFKSRNTSAGSFTIIQDNDILGDIMFFADDGTDAISEGARIFARVHGTPGANDMPTELVFGTAYDGANAIVENMSVSNAGHVGISDRHTSDSSAGDQCFKVINNADNQAIFANANNTSMTSAVTIFRCNRSGSQYYELNSMFSNAGGSADKEFRVDGDGDVHCDGSFSGSGADYAEYFQTKDGNSIAVGKTVVLDGDKVRASTDSDNASDILGIVRPGGNGQMQRTSVVIGNAQSMQWHGKYLIDDYDAYVLEEYTTTTWYTKGKNADGEWIEGEFYHSYETDKIPADGTEIWGAKLPPDNAVVTATEKDGVTKLKRKKLNPSYDESKTYVPREDRDEWVLIGLLGQVPMTKGEKTGSGWTKMKDRSGSVELWYIK